MAKLKIIKLALKTWKHNSDVDGDFILTKFYAKTDGTDFLLVESYGSKRRKYKINEIEVYDIGGSAETFANFEDLFLRLEALSYPAFYVDGEFTFDPLNYDLSEFTNNGTNPFATISDIQNSKFESVAINNNVSGTYAINYNTDIHRLTLTGNTTFTETNIPPSGKGRTITLEVNGNFGVIFPANFATFLTGEYKDDATLNTIVIECFDDFRKVQISQPS